MAAVLTMVSIIKSVQADGSEAVYSARIRDLLPQSPLATVLEVDEPGKSPEKMNEKNDGRPRQYRSLDLQRGQTKIDQMR